MAREVTTLQHLRRWKAANAALRAGMYVAPAVPTGIIMGINWEEWFTQNASRGWSIGVGFAMLLVAFVSALLGMVKKDEVLKEKVGGFLYLAVLFAVIGFALVMLASILEQLGWYFVWVAVSLVGSTGLQSASDKWSGKWVEFYAKVADDNGLTKESAKRMEARRQAAREAAQEEARRRAVE